MTENPHLFVKDGMNKAERLTTLSAEMGVTLTPDLLASLLSTNQDVTLSAPIFTETDELILRQLGDILIPKTSTPGAMDVKAQDYVNSYIRRVISEEDQKTLYKNYSSWKAQFTMRHRMSAEKANLAILTEEVSQRFEVPKEMQDKVLAKDPSIGQENLNCYAFLISFIRLTIIGYTLSKEVSEEDFSHLPQSESLKNTSASQSYPYTWALG